MKKAAFILVCIWSLSALNAQVSDLTGVWTVFETTYVADNEPERTTTENIYKEVGMQVNYYFMEDGKLKHTGSKTDKIQAFSEEGTWKIKGNEIIMTFNVGEEKRRNDYTYEFKGDTLFMTLVLNPEENRKLTIALRKKQE